MFAVIILAVNILFVQIIFGVEVKPWEAQPRTGSWLKTHELFLKNTEEHGNQTKVVFIGASITQFWQNEGKDIWISQYVSRGAVNYGIGGDTTSNVLWRIQNHELDGLTPKVIVLQIGYNNFHSSSPPPTGHEIAKGIIEVINELKTKCPETKIINIGITPLKESNLRSEAKEINGLLEKNADQKQVFYLDIGPQMVNSDGNQKPGIFRDGLHLTSEGYKIWDQTMKPLFDKLYH